MSNRNRRVKHLEKTVRTELIDLESDILQLHEENSNLRLRLEEQSNYIKEYTKEFRAEVELLREGLQLLAENEKIIERNHRLLAVSTNRTAESLADMKKTLIGRVIFK